MKSCKTPKSRNTPKSFINELNTKKQAMINTLTIPKRLESLKKPPKELYYIGNKDLLDRFKIAIVGTRRPNQYTQITTATLAQKLSKHATIISGGAIGIDSIAHINSMPNTIMISPASLDINYPKENNKLINDIKNKALIISEYKSPYFPKKYSFLERNRIVIALSDIVIFPQGDLNSGTNYSAKIAIELNKPIWTIPHRYKESPLSEYLITNHYAKVIYDIDDFIKDNIPDSKNTESLESKSDEILEFCKNAPSFEVALEKFGDKILEYEFMGLLIRQNNKIKTNDSN